MKKLFVSIVALLVLFCLAACNNTTPKDEVEPEINGVKNLTSVVGEEVDLLAGVTAVDDVDGNITSNIEVTTLPQLTVTDGKVTATLSGDYEIQYKVTDKAGNIGEAYATLSVTPALAEKVVYQEFAFDAPTIEGWGTYINEACTGTYGIVKGNYQINVSHSSREAWHVKFENNYPTEAGVDYKVTYNFISNAAGQVVANGKWVDIEVGASSVSYEFVGTGENYYLEFQLGALADSFIVDITSVEMLKRVGQDVYTEVTPNFAYNAEGVAYSAFDNNSTGNLTTTENSATLDITRGSDENGCWQTKLFVKPGFDLEANKKYKISVDVYSQNGHKFEICFNNGDAEKGIGALYGLMVEAGETKTFEYTVKHESAKDNLVLLFQLGELLTPQGTDVITVSNLKIEEVGGDKEESSTTTVFTPVGFGTYNDSASAAGSLFVENGKLVYEMTKIGLTDWHNKMYIERLTLEADKIYTISFTAKADKEISCAFFLNVFGKWDPRLSSEVKFTTTEQVFELQVTSAFAAEMDFELLWQFGSEANNALGSARIEFSNITIYSQDVQ